MKTIRTSRTTNQGRNVRFQLLQEVLFEIASYKPYFLFRKDLQTALLSGAGCVRYALALNVSSRNIKAQNCDFAAAYAKAEFLHGKLRQGKTQRGKLFLQIGCMRFVGENRQALVRWAKSAK